MMAAAGAVVLLPPPPPAGSGLVVVWEWLSEQQRWRPYSSRVCRHIETAIGTRGAGGGGGSSRGGGSVVLGQAEPLLASYIIDLQSMCQFRQDTGTMRPIRKRYFPVDSAPGRGIVWKWEQDGGAWTCYEADLCAALQDAYERRRPGLDLTALSGLPYYVDFSNMCQINPRTNFRRRILVTYEAPYPPASSPPPPLPMHPQPHYHHQPQHHQQQQHHQQHQQHQQAGGAALGHMQFVAQTLQPGPGAGQGNGSSHSSGPLVTAASSTSPVPTQAAAAASSSSPGSPVPHAQSTQAWPLSCGCQQCQGRPPTQKRKASQSGMPVPAAAARPGPPPLSPTSSVAGVGVPMPPGLMGPVVPISRMGPTTRGGPMRLAAALPPPGMPSLPGNAMNLPISLQSAFAAGGGLLPMTRALPKHLFHPPAVSKDELRPVPGVSGTCRKIKKSKGKKGKKSPEDVVKKYLQMMKNPPDEDCTICMERLAVPSGYEGMTGCTGVRADGLGQLGRCGHAFHLLCLVAMYSNGNKDGSLQCPTCKTIYGEKTGTQPPGKMEFHVIPFSLPGQPDCHAIRIIYDIPSGTQGPEHPNPGKKFTARGFPRHCYLPDSEEGRKVLKLLIVAWERRLIFTVGTSSTTGEADTVVWNEIHHKTEFGSNVTGHGFPDPNYLQNVQAELAAQGVTEALLLD
ncbi:E3 ubiquitin-protein ligase DTX1-like isoform X2 [Lampetra planeri]